MSISSCDAGEGEGRTSYGGPPPIAASTDQNRRASRAGATADQADLLGIPSGEKLLVRAVTQQRNGLRRASRLFLPFSVAESTPWAGNPHLPPAAELYDHFSQTGHKLTWTEHVRARMPIGGETLHLEVPPGVPLLIVQRLAGTTRGSGRTTTALALEEIRHRADQVELTYSVT